MRLGGKVVGTWIIIATLLIVVLALAYTHTLQQARNDVLLHVNQLPGQEECNYEDLALCPQAEDNVVIPNRTGFWMAALAIILGCYLIRMDRTNRGILKELKTRHTGMSRKAERDLIYSVLTKAEKKVVEAVRKQPGISQATLRLRADMSKAKLSQLLKELETRKILQRSLKGKTNTVHLKRRL